jgi:hypothetical protein
VVAALVATGAIAAAAGGGVPAALGQAENDLPISQEWLSNTISRGAAMGQVENNTIAGAIERRDAATAAWKSAVATYKASLAQARKAPRAKRARAVRQARKLYPDPKAQPQYNVVWSAKQNGADVNAGVVSKLVQNATVNPQGLAEMFGPQFAPGLDGFQVIDVRKLNLDGSRNPDYGKVVNFVQLPLPWGVETEAHHMQYDWEDGDPIVAGGLYNGATFVLDPKDVPNLRLTNTISQADHPLGSIPDAFEAAGGGRYIGTHMGGPTANFGGSPGSVFVLKPDAKKGLVLEKEVPAGSIGGASGGNAGGVPEPCSTREARPLQTCANPHGIQIRQDLDRMVTSDYAEPREIVLDPVKTLDKYAFRPTVRTWDTSNAANPKLISVAHMPKGWRKPAQRAHENYGIMENAKTWPQGAGHANTLESKGYFAGSMCGGGVFFTPDATKLKGDSSSKWVQVWDDGLSQMLAKGGNPDEFLDEPGGCAGGAWHQVARNNRWLFRSVQGRVPGADNYFDQGSTKMVYDIDIQPLIRSAQDGEVACDIARGIDTDGDGDKDLTPIEAVHRLAQGEAVADCPRFLDALIVKDPTTGGPHWGALDNHSSTPDGFPTRLTFSNYFVSRTGVDGDHRFYVVDIDPATGKLIYDQAFRDENTGALGVNFNRREWPGSPAAGFYKPHSMVWVCPPGVCPRDSGALPRLAASASSATKRLTFVSLRSLLRKLNSSGRASVRIRKAGASPIRKVRIVVRDSNGRLVASSAALRTMRSSIASLVVKRITARKLGGKRAFKVTVAGVDAKGTPVTGSARTLRL